MHALGCSSALLASFFPHLTHLTYYLFLVPFAVLHNARVLSQHHSHLTIISPTTVLNFTLLQADRSPFSDSPTPACLPSWRLLWIKSLSRSFQRLSAIIKLSLANHGPSPLPFHWSSFRSGPPSNSQASSHAPHRPSLPPSWCVPSCPGVCAGLSLPSKYSENWIFHPEIWNPSHLLLWRLSR